MNELVVARYEIGSRREELEERSKLRFNTKDDTILGLFVT